MPRLKHPPSVTFWNAIPDLCSIFEYFRAIDLIFVYDGETRVEGSNPSPPKLNQSKPKSLGVKAYKHSTQ
jgi:hypothetical protein